MNETNPYVLGEKTLNFSNFADDLKLTNDDSTVKFCFVFGSGRSGKSAHVGFITDTINIPEIVLQLAKCAEKDELDIDIKSKFDIDLEREEDKDLLSEYNLLLFGSPNVNCITEKWHDYFQLNLKVRFLPEHGFMAIFDDIEEHYYHPITKEYKDYGILTMTYNPWAREKGKNRLIIILAGIHPVGTIAASYYLLDCIGGEGGRNHLQDDRVPAVIVQALTLEGEYPKKFRSSPHLTDRYIGNIRGVMQVR